MHGSAAPLVSSSTVPNFPLTFDPTREGFGRFVLMALAAPALVALLIPFWLVAQELVAEPTARAMVAERPMLAIGLVAGPLVLLAMFGWPLVSLVGSALFRRRIRIDGRSVAAEEHGLTGVRTWTEPISAYLGIMHRVRSSVSGARQELVLVHPEPARSVVVLTSPLISQEVVGQVARLLSLAEISSREVATLRSLHASARLAEAQSRLGAGLLRTPGL